MMYVVVVVFFCFFLFFLGGGVHTTILYFNIKNDTEVFDVYASSLLTVTVRLWSSKRSQTQPKCTLQVTWYDTQIHKCALMATWYAAKILTQMYTGGHMIRILRCKDTDTNVHWWPHDTLQRYWHKCTLVATWYAAKILTQMYTDGHMIRYKQNDTNVHRWPRCKDTDANVHWRPHDTLQWHTNVWQNDGITLHW